MKRLILLLALMVATVAVHAQTTLSIVQAMYSDAASGTKLLDTVTDAGTATLSSKIVKGTPVSTTVGIQFTKLTGTLGGTATLKGSFDGVIWYTASSTTYTVTNVATQTNSWQITGSPYLYFQVSWTGTGTMSGTMNNANVLTRNQK